MGDMVHAQRAARGWDKNTPITRAAWLCTPSAGQTRVPSPTLPTPPCSRHGQSLRSASAMLGEARHSRGGRPAPSRMCGFLQMPPPCSIPRQGWALGVSGAVPHPGPAASQPMHLVGSGAALQEEAEPVAGPLVVLQPLAQAPVVILHEAPVQDHLQLACREQVPRPGL